MTRRSWLRFIPASIAVPLGLRAAPLKEAALPPLVTSGYVSLKDNTPWAELTGEERIDRLLRGEEPFVYEDREPEITPVKWDMVPVCNWEGDVVARINEATAHNVTGFHHGTVLWTGRKCIVLKTWYEPCEPFSYEDCPVIRPYALSPEKARALRQEAQAL